MEKETKKNFNEFFSALLSGAIGGSLGTYIANLLDLHWALLGILVVIIFLISYKLLLLLFSKSKKDLNEFFSALLSGAIGGSLGTYIANLLDLHWALLGVFVVIIFLISYNLFLLLFKKLSR